MYTHELDRLTDTFSADQRYCAELVAQNADGLARLIVFSRWAAGFMPTMREDLHASIRHHFQPEMANDAGFWTVTLISSVHRDISLPAYLAIRGLGVDAGLVIRRSLEHVGVLAHLWAEPAKAAFLSDPDSDLFKRAFVSESDAKRAAQFKSQGIQKRFEHCYLAPAASSLYRLLSGYTIHGGSPKQFATIPPDPSPISCLFLDRLGPSAASVRGNLEVLGNGVEILCAEVCSIIRLVARTHRTASAKSGEGVRFVSEILDHSVDRMSSEIASTKAALGWP